MVSDRGNVFWDAANLRQRVESKIRKTPTNSMITGSCNMGFLFGLDLNLLCMSSYACRFRISGTTRFDFNTGNTVRAPASGGL
jgi:hypothetical protein